MAGDVKNKKGFKDSMTNPLIGQIRKKMDKFTETSDEYMTYSGVAKKTAFFLIMAFVGAAIAAILNSRLPKNIVNDGVPAVNSTVVLISLVCAFVMLGVTIAAIFVKGKALAVLGAIAMICIGFSYNGLVASTPKMAEALKLAIIITVFLVIALLILYSSGSFRVSPKLRKVVLACVLASAIIGVFSIICMLIPGLRGIVSFFRANPVLSITAGIIGVIIATLFLMTDFDSINMMVEEGAPKKYEWLAAYGLAFSIVWLFLKVFQLIVSVKNAER